MTSSACLLGFKSSQSPYRSHHTWCGGSNHRLYSKNPFKRVERGKTLTDLAILMAIGTRWYLLHHPIEVGDDFTGEWQRKIEEAVRRSSCNVDFFYAQISLINPDSEILPRLWHELMQWFERAGLAGLYFYRYQHTLVGNNVRGVLDKLVYNVRGVCRLPLLITNGNRIFHNFQLPTSMSDLTGYPKVYRFSLTKYCQSIS